jgi:hypothetical protein
MKLRRTELGVMGLLLTAIGGVSLHGAAQRARDEFDFSHRVEARVLGDGKCSQHLGVSSIRGTARRLYTPFISYQYEYGEKVYVSRDVFRSREYGFYSPEECNQYIARLTSEGRTEAWLDPLHPETSVLMPQRASRFIEWTLVSLGVGLLGIFGMSNIGKAKR